MSPQPDFTLTYWGTMGTTAAPLRPEQITDKLVAAIVSLAGGGQLGALGEKAGDAGQVRALVERELAFHQRATYGGNTTCIELRTSEELIIIDAGTGNRALGIDLERRWKDVDDRNQRVAHLFLTHAHIDHITAIPFVDAYYDARNDVRIRGPQEALDALRAVMQPGSAMQGVYFPTSDDMLAATRILEPVVAGQSFDVGSTTVHTMALNHPGGAVAYRFDRGGHSVVIATDHEHPEVPDRKLAKFAAGADLLYIDSQYLDDELTGLHGIAGGPALSRQGWGHSTVEQALTTAIAAGVARVHLGHREPRRDDAELHRIESAAMEKAAQLAAAEQPPTQPPEVAIPHEGLVVTLGDQGANAT